MAEQVELLAGTLDLLILSAVSLSYSEGVHGCGLVRRIAQISDGALRIGQGALYPALGRLEQQGWLRSWWGTSTRNRRAKYYALTAEGQTKLEERRQSWHRIASTMARTLQFSAWEL